MTKTDTRPPKLLPGEKLLEIKEYPEAHPDNFPSSTKVIEELTKTSSVNEIGVKGPVVAAEAIKSHKNIKDFHRYEAVFGRDSLRVAEDLVDEYPELARTTLMYLASQQGMEVNKEREEEVGRILHEDRNPDRDPIAKELTRTNGWGWPYYGTVDATPQFLRLLAAYCHRVADGPGILNQTFRDRSGKDRTIVSAMDLALEWIISRLNANKEGLLEFKRAIPGGLENQMWRDSWDSFFHEDGTVANHEAGIASIDVQRVAYEALLDSAGIYANDLNKVKESVELRERAKLLKTAIFDHFWCQDKAGYFVIGTDRDSHGNLRQLKVRSSDMGHLLHSRLLSGAEYDDARETVIRQLFSNDMLGINGIMSISSDSYRYREGAYHNGSVWGWDNYLIAQGLRANGYFALSDFIEQRVLEVIAYSHRYVEFSCGGRDPSYRIPNRLVRVWDSINNRENVIEEAPQDMQAWTVAAVAAIEEERKKRQLSRMAIDPKKRKLELEILSGDSVKALS